MHTCFTGVSLLSSSVPSLPTLLLDSSSGSCSSSISTSSESFSAAAMVAATLPLVVAAAVRQLDVYILLLLLLSSSSSCNGSSRNFVNSMSKLSSLPSSCGGPAYLVTSSPLVCRTSRHCNGRWMDGWMDGWMTYVKMMDGRTTW